MSIFALLKPALSLVKLGRSLPVMLGLLILSSAVVTYSPTVQAQEVQIDSGILDYEKVLGPRWIRVNFDPLIFGDNTIRVASDGSADVRFAVYQILDTPSPNNRIRIATSTNSSTLAEWTGVLDTSEQYYVGVWSVSGSTNFTATIEADIEVDPLEISVQPTNLSVGEGSDATFTVIAAGSGALSYQWYVNNVAIAGATTDTFTITSTSLSDDGGVYRVDITDSLGYVSSNNATLEVLDNNAPSTVFTFAQGTLDADRIAGPRWVRHDFNSLATANHTIKVSWDSGANVRYKVFAADGTQLSATILGSNPGVWSGSFDVNSQFYISLWSTNGIANYSATVEATVPITIVNQPFDRIVTEGDDATFAVEATGSGAISYQWFADGSPIIGETDDTLTILAASLFENETLYNVEASNGFQTVSSDLVSLTVNEPIDLGLFSQEADPSAWMLDGPAPTLDFNAGANTPAWGQALLRIDDVLLVGGDFEGIKPGRFATPTDRPFLAALDAVTGQPVSTFQIPSDVNSVVRALTLSPNGSQVYVGGDFGLLALDAITGALDFSLSVMKGNNAGRVFDIAVTDTELYIGGDFNNVNDAYRANIARLSLNGVLDSTWRPKVTHGYNNGRSATVQSIAISETGDVVYIGGNFRFIDSTPVALSTANSRVSMLSVSAVDGSVLPERFSPDVGGRTKGLTAYDIVVTEFYVIIAWGGPNYLSFHSLDGTRLQQYKSYGDVQALQVVGDHVFVGHHGEAVSSSQLGVIPHGVDVNATPYKLHSFRIDDPSFLPEQTWQISGTFGVWGIAAAEDSIWVAGDIFQAGSNELLVEGLVRFPAQ